MLQLREHHQTYFKDSYKFKKLVETVRLRPGSRLFTADTVSMYTNIDTNKALALICPFLRENKRLFGYYNATTLIRAIEIVMRNNIVKFGDTYAKQIKGTDMGETPAPACAGTFE